MTPATPHDPALIPPAELLFDGSRTIEEFLHYGEGFARDVLTPRARLRPTDVFLDIGCGNGGVARWLTTYLKDGGRYEGLDISADGIAWLQEHYRAYPNFRFTHSTVYNKMYNAGGVVPAAEYVFPYPDASVDVALLKSVFTHMLPADVRRYLAELHRVVKPEGRIVATYFLLNAESRRLAAAGQDTLQMSHAWDGDPLCQVASLDVPEQATAHDETRIRGFYIEAGLQVCDIAYGNWCGRPSLLGFQDMIVAVR